MAKPKAEEWIIEEKLIILEGWARDGLIDEQIAENIVLMLTLDGNTKTLLSVSDLPCILSLIQ